MAPLPMRVLVIDDDPDAALLLALAIRSAAPGIATRCAGDGGAGVAIACDWRPHLVITDIDMPVLSGIDAALEIRFLLPVGSPLIVALTGDLRWCDDPMARAAFDAVLAKPVEIEAIACWCDVARPSARHDALLERR